MKLTTLPNNQPSNCHPVITWLMKPVNSMLWLLSHASIKAERNKFMISLLTIWSDGVLSKKPDKFWQKNSVSPIWALKNRRKMLKRSGISFQILKLYYRKLTSVFQTGKDYQTTLILSLLWLISKKTP